MLYNVSKLKKDGTFCKRDFKKGLLFFVCFVFFFNLKKMIGKAIVKHVR